VREAGVLGNAVIQDAARRFAANVLPVIREVQAAGARSNAAIAAKLNERRVPTARGGVWTHVQVRAVIGRGVPSLSAKVSDRPQSGHLNREKSGLPRSP
jgi:hypothetical protein